MNSPGSTHGCSSSDGWHVATGKVLRIDFPDCVKSLVLGFAHRQSQLVQARKLLGSLILFFFKCRCSIVMLELNLSIGAFPPSSADGGALCEIILVQTRNSLRCGKLRFLTICVDLVQKAIACRNKISDGHNIFALLADSYSLLHCGLAILIDLRVWSLWMNLVRQRFVRIRRSRVVYSLRDPAHRIGVSRSGACSLFQDYLLLNSDFEFVIELMQ